MKKYYFDFTTQKDADDFFAMWNEEITRAERTLCGGIKLYKKDTRKPCLTIAENVLNVHWGNIEAIEKELEAEKWIGKLCRFWDNEEEHKSSRRYGILQKIRPSSAGYMMYESNTGWGYKHCEPVYKFEIGFVE